MSQTSQKPAEEAAAPGGDALVALQAQIGEMRADLGQLKGLVEKMAAPEGSAGVRIARLEKAVCILAAIVGELHSNAAKSNIAELQDELRGHVAPLNQAIAVALGVDHAG